MGVNRFRSAEEKGIPTFQLDPAMEQAQTARLRELRSTRDQAAVTQALQRLNEAARGTANLMPRIMDAAAAYATVGEISDALRAVFGEYVETGN